MGAALLVGAFGLLALPRAIRRMSLGTEGAARTSIVSLTFGSLLLEAGFVACAIALCAICTEALLGGEHGHFFPGGRIAGYLSLALAVAFPISIAVGLVGSRRRIRTMHLEPWVGKHIERSGYQVVVLPTRSMIAYATAGRNGQIVVSEGLLSTLTPDEVDAVLAHEAAHVRNRHPLYLLPVAALEPAAFVLPALRSSLTATRYATERWADEEAIDLGGDRSSLVSALGRISTVPPTSPITFLGAEDVEGRVQALEVPSEVRSDHTALVVGGLVACSVVSIAALMIWL